MWIPNSYKNINLSELQTIMKRYNFAQLISFHEGQIQDTSIPFVLSEEEAEHGVLYGHIAKANPQSLALATGQLVSVIFQGGHAYISPHWYKNRESRVPTWNYLKVTAKGIPEMIEEPHEVLNLLNKLSLQHEVAFRKPWNPEEAKDYVEKLLRAITPFKIPIQNLEGQFKLSQDHFEDYPAIIAALKKSQDAGEQEIASMMSKQRYIRKATLPEDASYVKELFAGYAEFLKRRQDCGYQMVLDEIPYLEPLSQAADDTIFLAGFGENLIGCAVMHPLESNLCEMKRVFVRDEFRGQQVGRALVLDLIKEAKGTCYQAVRLCTNPLLSEAVRLYESFGFKKIAPYYDEPVANPIFMELVL